MNTVSINKSAPAPDRPAPSQLSASNQPPRGSARSWWKRPAWNRFTPLQLVVMGLATIAPVVISASAGARILGLISTEEMISVALGAGENPGMLTFGAMFLASPMQWLTGRSQVRVRKFLGIVFFLLALSNLAMFVLETGLGSALSAPFLVAGTVAIALALPLFLTSSRRSQRLLGMHRWRVLHKLTYVVAFALLGHVILIGDIGPGAVMIALGFIARIPSVRHRLEVRQGFDGCA